MFVFLLYYRLVYYFTQNQTIQSFNWKITEPLLNIIKTLSIIIKTLSIIIDNLSINYL